MVKEVPELGPGRAGLLASGQSGWMNMDPESVVDFIESFVARRTSDVAKLAASGADERHLFVWSGMFSEAWAVLRALGTDIEALPTRQPKLPDVVTDVWVANEMHRPSRIVHWSLGEGWEEVGLIDEAQPLSPEG